MGIEIHDRFRRIVLKIEATTYQLLILNTWQGIPNRNHSDAFDKYML